MYSRRTGFILGFHGCDREIRDKIVSEKGVLLKPSENSYDWLGHGAYFWENNHERALKFAEELKENPPKGKENLVKEAVLGAIIDLGYCLDLLDSKYLEVLKESYDFLLESAKKYHLVLPKNIKSPSGEFLIRNLDCAVIESVHKINKDLGRDQYDSVRGVFLEGEELYEDAGFKEKKPHSSSHPEPNLYQRLFYPKGLRLSITSTPWPMSRKSG